jgi:hypothetical protein
LTFGTNLCRDADEEGTDAAYLEGTSRKPKPEKQK